MRSYIYIMLLLCFCSTQVFAEAISVEELREIQSKFKSSDYLKVEFEQKVVNPRRPGRVSKSLGRLLYAKPGIFRWMLIKPVPNEWIFNGKKVCHYAPDEKTATCYKSTASQAREIKQIVQLVTDIDVLLSSYNLKKADMKKGKVQIELTPKAVNSIEKVELTLHIKKNYISHLRLYFSDKTHSTFIFTDPDIKRISRKNFDVPSGVKISNGF